MDPKRKSLEMSKEEMVTVFHRNSEVDMETCQEILEQNGWNLTVAFENLGLSCPWNISASPDSSTDSTIRKPSNAEGEPSWVTCSPRTPKKKSTAQSDTRHVVNSDKGSLIKRYPIEYSKDETDVMLRRELCYPKTKEIILNLGSSEAKLTLVLLRGLPGSGKSTLGSLLVCLSETGIKLSADDYFYCNGKYNFDRNKLPNAHASAQYNCEISMSKRLSPVVIDNTNTEFWEMIPYAKLAVQYGYSIEIAEPNTKWKFETRVLVKKNAHGVPKEALDRMKKRFDHSVTVNSLVIAGGGTIIGQVIPEFPKPESAPASPRPVSLSDCVVPQNSNQKRKSRPTQSIPTPPTTPADFLSPTSSLTYDNNCKFPLTDLNQHCADLNIAGCDSVLPIANPRRAAVFPHEADTVAKVKLADDFWHDEECTGNATNLEHNLFSGNVNSNRDLKVTEEVREHLRTMFPNQKLELLVEYYRTCGGDINYCCDLLLDSGYGAISEVPTAVVSDTVAQNENPEDWFAGELEKLGAVGGDDTSAKVLLDQSSFEEDVARRPAHSDEVSVPIDGEDWLDLQLPKDFVSKLTENYSNPIYGTELASLPLDYLQIKVPPKIAFKIFQLLSLNVMKKVELNSTAQDEEQIESDAKFAAFLAENEFSDVYNQEPTLVQISNLEVKVRNSQLLKARESIDEIPIKFASLLKLHKLKSCFPTIPEDIVKQYFDDSGETFDVALERLKNMYPRDFEPGGLCERLECTEEIKSAVNKQLQTLQKMKADSSPEPEDKTGFEWRDISMKHYKLRQEYQEKVRIASRESHHYEVARHYAVMSATHHEQMNLANGKAKEWFLLHFNQTGSANRLDLHGQTTKDALQLLGQYIVSRVNELKSSSTKRTVLQIITGRGNNSVDGVARLHPAVKDYLNRKRLSYEEDSGQFFIHITPQTKF